METNKKKSREKKLKLTLLQQVGLYSLIVLFFACKSDDDSKVTPNENDKKYNYQNKMGEVNGETEFLDFYYQESDGYIGLEEEHSFGTEVEVGNIRSSVVRAAFYDQQGELIPLGDLSIEDLTLSADPNYDNMYWENSHNSGFGLYGSELTIELLDEQGNDDLITSFYSPDLIYATKTDTTNQINTNTTLNWNSDPSNNIGIAIVATYDPNLPENVGFTNHNTKMTNYIYFEQDNGTASLSSELFEGFPLESFIL
ncbi:MAG: hypothetical protein WD512_03065, partial [Candidatus Paceibacterota bacterium]